MGRSMWMSASGAIVTAEWSPLWHESGGVARFRLTKIYTRTGDDGTTGLGGGQRVEKDSERIEAYGTVDELNSALGVAAASSLDVVLLGMCKQIQNDLFDVGSDLCVLQDDKRTFKMRDVEAKQV